jgi:hypothetical protein
VLNAAFVPALPHFQLYVQAYARAYLLSCYYDVFQSLGINPVGFTPNKVTCVLAQPMPKLILDALRELIRPVVTPYGQMLYPDPTTFLNDRPYEFDSEVRNTVKLGHPDRFLLKYGIQWFVCLGHCFRAAWMTGTSDGAYAITLVEDMKREGLEPAKVAMLLELCEVKKDDKDKVDGVVAKAPPKDVAAFVSSGLLIQSEIDAREDEVDKKKELKDKKVDVSEMDLSKNANWGKLYNKAGEPDVGYDRSLFQFPKDDVKIIRHYWMHDFDAEADKTRDFAMRMLRPLVVKIYDNIFDGRVQLAYNVAPPDLAFLGVDVWRGSVPYTLWEFQQMKDKFEGHPVIESRAFYIARWISMLSLELKKWHFPSIGESLPIRPADNERSSAAIGDGRGRRRARNRGRGRGIPAAPAIAVRGGFAGRGRGVVT